MNAPIKPEYSIVTTLEHQIAVVVECHGAGERKGARISLTLPRFSGKRVYLPYEYEHNDIVITACGWLDSKGILPATRFDLGVGKGYLLGVPWKQVELVHAAFKIET